MLTVFFKKTMHTMNSNNTVQANVIGGVTGQDNIAEPTEITLSKYIKC